MPEKAIITLKVDPEVKDAVVTEAARRGVSATALVVEFIKSEIPIRPPAPIPGQLEVDEVIAEIEREPLPVSIDPDTYEPQTDLGRAAKKIHDGITVRSFPVETFSPDCPNRAYHQLTMHCRVCGGYRA